MSSCSSSSMELEWPDKNPLDVLDYSVDVSADLVPGETILSIRSQIKPSGDGELSIGGRDPSVYAQDENAIVWLTGGVPGRTYLVRVLVNTDQNRVYEYLVTLRMSDVLAEPPLVEAPVDDFGPTVSWNYQQQAQVAIQGQGMVSVNAS